MEKNLIRDIPVGDRPYERCEKYGPSVLSDTELLSVLLRNGTGNRGVGQIAGEIIKLCGDDNPLGRLADLSGEELRKIDGIGKVKAIELLCLCELSKRMWRQSRFGQRVRILSSSQAASYYMEELRHLDKEQVYILLLDAKQYVLGDIRMSEGTADMSPVSVREILKKALLKDAGRLIFVHNHPSGDPTPSKEDLKTTDIILKGCLYIGIRMLDSIIIGDGIYFSFLEKGKNFEQL